MNKLRRIFSRRRIEDGRGRILLWTKDTELLEVGCALASGMWGVWLLLWYIILQGDPVTAQVHFSFSRAFWGTILLILSLLHWYSLFTNCASGREHTAFTSCIVWGLVVWQAAYNAPELTPTASSIVFFLLNFFVYVRLRILPPTDRARGRGLL